MIGQQMMQISKPPLSGPPGVFTLPGNKSSGPGYATQQNVMHSSAGIAVAEKISRRKSIGDASTDAGDSDREKEILPTQILSSPMESEDSGSEMDVMNNSGELPSVGSIRHDQGQCLRCCFFPKGRCQNGYNCKFCHFDHEKRQRKSSKKSTKVSLLPRSDSRDGSAEDFQVPLIPPPGLEDAFPRLPAAPPSAATQTVPAWTPAPQELAWLDAWVPFANSGLREPMPRTAINAPGVPVKVALKGFSCDTKVLDPRIPAKKKPPNFQVPAFATQQGTAVPCY